MSCVKLYNGDCFDILPTIPKNKKICVVTDPPFNINYKYSVYKDNIEEKEYFQKLRLALYFNENPFVCVHYPESLYKLAIEIGIAPTKVVSWVYNSNVPRQHRDIAFWGVCPDFSKVTQPYKNPNDKRIKERISRGILGCKLYDWWNVNQIKNVQKKKINHPCVMPQEVLDNIIGILPEEYLIVDPFMGAGTTGISCKKMNRDFIGIELDEEYFKIAKERIGG